MEVGKVAGKKGPATRRARMGSSLHVEQEILCDGELYVRPEIVASREEVTVDWLLRCIKVAREGGKEIRSERFGARGRPNVGKEFFCEADLFAAIPWLGYHHRLFIDRIRSDIDFYRQKTPGLNEKLHRLLVQLVLWRLEHLSWPTHRELGKVLGLPKTTIASQLRRLEELGYIERQYYRIQKWIYTDYRIHKCSQRLTLHLAKDNGWMMDSFSKGG